MLILYNLNMIFAINLKVFVVELEGIKWQDHGLKLMLNDAIG